DSVVSDFATPMPKQSQRSRQSRTWIVSRPWANASWTRRFTTGRSCFRRHEPRSTFPAKGPLDWAATYLLMGLRYSDELTDSLLEGVQNMHESTTYEVSGRFFGFFVVRGSKEERVVLWTSTASTSPRRSWSGTTPPLGWKGSGSGRAGRSR